jgi:hypothetical protein
MKDKKKKEKRQELDLPRIWLDQSLSDAIDE